MEPASPPTSEPSHWQSEWVASLATGVFWISALTGWAGAALFLSRVIGLPPLVSEAAGLLCSVIFGFVMFSAFLTLRGVREWWELAPPGNAFGTPIGCADLVMPYLILAGAFLFLFPLFARARLTAQRAARQASQKSHHLVQRDLGPVTLPLETIWVPIGIAGLMGAAAVWSYRTRPLHHAALDGDVNGVLSRLDRGVPVDTEDRYTGRTPLVWAIREYRTEVVHVLLDHGADPNYPDRYGKTPLHQAAATGQAEVVRLLLVDGADPNMRSRQQVWGQSTDTTPLIEGAAFADVAQALVEAGADANARSLKGVTALIQAADHCRRVALKAEPIDSTDSVRLLLASGADVNARDDRGRTALIEAAPFPEMVRALLEAGADVNAQTADGVTPLIRVADDWRVSDAEEESKAVESVRLLLDHGGDLHARDSHNRTALDVARQRGRQQIVNALSEAGARE